jgi:hypothetical protein
MAVIAPVPQVCRATTRATSVIAARQAEIHLDHTCGPGAVMRQRAKRPRVRIPPAGTHQGNLRSRRWWPTASRRPGRIDRGGQADCDGFRLVNHAVPVLHDQQLGPRPPDVVRMPGAVAYHPRRPVSAKLVASPQTDLVEPHRGDRAAGGAALGPRSLAAARPTSAGFRCRARPARQCGQPSRAVGRPPAGQRPLRDAALAGHADQRPPGAPAGLLS